MPRLSHLALVPSGFCQVSKRNDGPYRPCGSAATLTSPGDFSTPSKARAPFPVSAAHSTAPGRAFEWDGDGLVEVASSDGDSSSGGTSRSASASASDEAPAAGACGAGAVM